MSDLQSLGLSRFGVATYFKAPRAEPDGEWTADAAFLGVPFDLGTGYRSGTRFGPKALRDMSMRFSLLTSEPPGLLDLRSNARVACCRLVDCGDTDILPLVWQDNFARMTSAVAAILAHGAIPFVMGGDHAITLPLIRAFAERGPITLVHFDAHLDYREGVGDPAPESGLRFGHGSVIRRVAELDFIEQVVSIGIRSLRHHRESVERHRADGNDMICAWDVHAHGVDPFADRLPNGRDVYVTFDIDSMDASLVAGTGTPEVGGLTYGQARRFLEIVCARNRVVGFDLVEVNPLFDPWETTSLLGVQLIAETLGFVFPDCHEGTST